MNDLNNVPSTGTFGNSINLVNQNFGLVKGAIENVEGRTIRSKGLFPTQAALTAAYPSPKVGDYAYVGSGLPATVYDCLVAGTWHNTGQTGGSETIDLSSYSTTAQMNTAIDNGLQGQVGYAVCNSNGSDRKDVVVNGFKLLASGGALHIKMTNVNTAANATMNISPTSTVVAANTKPLFYNGMQASATNTWEANEIISVFYDGTYYQASNARGGGSSKTNEKILVSKFIKSDFEQGSYTTGGALTDSSSRIRLKAHYINVSQGDTLSIKLNGLRYYLFLFDGSDGGGTMYFSTSWQTTDTLIVFDRAGSFGLAIGNSGTLTPSGMVSDIELSVSDSVADSVKTNFITKALNNSRQDIMPSALSTTRVINSSDKWVTVNNYSGTVVDVRGYDEVRISSHPVNGTRYTFLTQYPVADMTVAYSAGISGLISINAGDESIIPIPKDAYFLYIYIRANDTYYTPRKVSLLTNRDKKDEELFYELNLNPADIVSAGGFVSVSDRKWKNTSGYNGGLINCEGYDNVTIIGNASRLTRFSFFSENPSVNSVIQFADGYISPPVIEPNEIVNVKVPSNAKFLYIFRASNSNDVRPTKTILRKGTLCSYIDQGIQTARKVSPVELKIATWNIGHFSNGAHDYSSITSSNYSSKLAQYRQLLYNNIKADVIALNEYNYWFLTSVHSAQDVLFNNYGFRAYSDPFQYSYNMIYSNIYIDNIGCHPYECLIGETIADPSAINATDYYYIAADLWMGGHKVKLISTHLAFDRTRDGVLQGKQLDELLNLYGGEERIIILGDMNLKSTTWSAYDNLINAGFSLANDGTLITTAASPLDNIIYRGVTLSDISVEDSALTDSLSDHKPISATLKL